MDEQQQWQSLQDEYSQVIGNAGGTGVLNTIGSWGSSLFGADQTAPFNSDHDKIVAQWGTADAANDDTGRAAAISAMQALIARAKATLYNHGNTDTTDPVSAQAITGTDVTVNLNDASNTYQGAVVQQAQDEAQAVGNAAASAGKALAFGAGTGLVLVAAAVVGYLLITRKVAP